jgi:hypothetical protein
VTPAGSPWGNHTIPEGEEISLSFGPMESAFRREGDELWIRTSVGDAPEAAPEGADWARWALPPGDGGRLHLAPALPDRLVVVKPQVSFQLIPGASARVYVRVPVHVVVRHGGADGSLLTEFPSMRMSDTWWGDLEDGALGYWLSTHARRALTPDLVEPHLAICTLNLSNRSRETLPVEKIALRVSHLSIFASGEGLWCDEVQVTWSGGEDSAIEMSGEVPVEAPGARLLVPPRHPVDRGFRARTFARIRGLPGFAGMA